MVLDAGQLNQLLEKVPFPIGKADLVRVAVEHGANDLIIGLINSLPDKTFNSSQDVQDSLSGSLDNLGSLGGFKL